MPYLLDVNVLIALLDENHVHHKRATRWFLAEAQNGWLSSPTTQNGAIRVMSGPKYGPTSFPPTAVVEQLRILMEETVHTFVADDATLLDPEFIDHARLRHSKQITDTYLLGLAVSHRSQLATMDGRLRTDAVAGGADHLHVIRKVRETPQTDANSSTR